MFYNLPEQVFISVSIILPVVNETQLLEKTVEIIMDDCSEDIHEFVIVICDKTTPESLDVCSQLKNKYGERIKILKQTLPFLGGAMRDAFDYVSGSHVIMMASDMETPPDKVKDFISEAKKYPNVIVTGSRWIKGGGFEEYSPLKFLLNFVFQRFFSILYRTPLTDMTYGYRIFPSQLVKSIRWEELRHPFLFETLVKPLRLGVKVIEIPTKWKARDEGGSQNTFMRNFEYFRIGIKTLFYSRRQILK
ncbi:MAG: glycosyltransferase family 2 protein [Candidatus Margulisbacteria bacterium]|nr:glycosyltransferase family 2 protein [Candidatus Margulisiibacteriota bacterium]